mmetsp:Transcript_22246/g.69701  ORF Transcript_22246/g.69701 Transcript_22246/m.69701 type:complete len:233 (+) Transcript_22246:1045-1743(+)
MPSVFLGRHHRQHEVEVRIDEGRVAREYVKCERRGHVASRRLGGAQRHLDRYGGLLIVQRDARRSELDALEPDGRADSRRDPHGAVERGRAERQAYRRAVPGALGQLDDRGLREDHGVSQLGARSRRQARRQRHALDLGERNPKAARKEVARFRVVDVRKRVAVVRELAHGAALGRGLGGLGHEERIRCDDIERVDVVNLQVFQVFAIDPWAFGRPVARLHPVDAEVRAPAA